MFHSPEMSDAKDDNRQTDMTSVMDGLLTVVSSDQSLNVHSLYCQTLDRIYM